jgi:hypothetical protein
VRQAASGKVACRKLAIIKKQKGTQKPTCPFPLALSQNKGEPTEDMRNITWLCP